MLEMETDIHHRRLKCKKKEIKQNTFAICKFKEDYQDNYFRIEKFKKKIGRKFVTFLKSLKMTKGLPESVN